MKTELYLNPRTKWVQLWEAFRIWIVDSPHVGADAKKALPTKIAKGASDFPWSGNRVKAILLQDVLDIKYSSLRDGTNWTTSIRFKKARRSIYTCITVNPEPASTPVEIKPPRIVKILQSRFGNMTESVRQKPKVVCEGKVGEGIVAKLRDAIANNADQTSANEIVTKIVSKIDQSSGDLKTHITAETDRGIAAKAPKRVRKFGHEGNGMKGPKTRKMKEQKRIFDTFLGKYPEGPDHSRISRAHECWLQHPGWVKAAKASGEAKGYASHKSLAAAR